jgi:GxxExxY protein
VERQKPLALRYDGTEIECGYRLDLLVAQTVIVELKAAEAIEPIHEAQVHTYLRLSGMRVGLLLNFNVVRMRDGIKRIVL